MRIVVDERRAPPGAEGKFCVSFEIVKDQVVISFEQDVTSLSMPPKDARNLAMLLLYYAATIDGQDFALDFRPGGLSDEQGTNDRTSHP